MIVGKMKVKSQEPNEIRCRYLVEVPFICRKNQVHAWVEYIKNQLPNSYEGEVGDAIGNDVIQMYLRYEANSANANDITRRLRHSGLEFVSQPSNRTKLCGCPDGTMKCLKRTDS